MTSSTKTGSTQCGLCLIVREVTTPDNMSRNISTVALVCNSILDAIFLLYAVLIGWIRFWLSFCMFSWLPARIFSSACSTVYFTFCTVAILTALNSVACTFLACFSINRLLKYSYTQEVSEIRERTDMQTDTYTRWWKYSSLPRTPIEEKQYSTPAQRKFWRWRRQTTVLGVISAKYLALAVSALQPLNFWWNSIPVSARTSSVVTSRPTTANVHSNPLNRSLLAPSSSGLTAWIPQTVYCYFWACPFLLFSFFFVLHFLAVGSVR